MQISVAVTDANNIVCTVVPPQTQTITIDRGVAGNGIVSIVPVTISTFQYLRITYTNGTVSDVGPLTSTAYTATAPISIVGNTISLLTVPIASGGTAATTAAAAIQNLLPSYTGNGSKRLGLNSGATALEWVTDGGGTVTSVALSGGSTGLTTSGGPITSSGTITLAGTLAIANGGSGQITAQLAINAFAGAVTSGSYLRGNGTNVVMATIQAADVPTLNQNTTGTAANVTGTVAIANGGTGQITANAAFNALAPSQTSQSGKYLTTDGTNTSWATNPLGTVTSVAATVPSFLSITGSPITTSGTLAISLSGTALPTTSGGTGLTSFTANGVVYASSTSALATGTALAFDGTTLSVGGQGTFANSTFTANTGIAAKTAAASGITPFLQLYNGNASTDLKTWRIGGLTSGALSIETVNDAYTVASGVMILTNAGNVGIGTSSPTSKLSFGANIGLDFAVYEGAGGANKYGIGMGGAGTTPNPYRTKLYANGVEYVSIDTNGLVGIGTSSPAALLDINGSSGWAGGTTGNVANIKGANATVTQGGNLRVLSSTSFGIDLGGSIALGGQYTSGFYLDFAQIAGRKENAIDNNTAGYLAFATRPNGGNTTERMRIDSSGKVGINVIPVAGTDAKLQLTGLATNATTLATAYSAASLVVVPKSTSGFSLAIASGTGDAPQLQVSANGAASGDLLIQPYGGNVGIGTSSPTALRTKNLEVSSGGTNDSAAVIVNKRGTGIATLRLATVGAATGFDLNFNFPNTGDLGFYDLAAAANRMTIDSNGNLLVNTSTSGGWSGDAAIASLANGSTKAWGLSAYNNTSANGGALLARVDNTSRQLLGLYYSTTNVGSITTNGTITVYGTTSDYRLKTVIGPVADAGQRIDALRPVEYTWNADGSHTRGFLAHQFQEVYAGSVTGSKDAVDAEGKPVYQAMQASSSEVIADLVAEIQSLRKRLADAGI